MGRTTFTPFPSHPGSPQIHLDPTEQTITLVGFFQGDPGSRRCITQALERAATYDQTLRGTPPRLSWKVVAKDAVLSAEAVQAWVTAVMANLAENRLYYSSDGSLTAILPGIREYRHRDSVFMTAGD